VVRGAIVAGRLVAAPVIGTAFWTEPSAYSCRSFRLSKRTLDELSWTDRPSCAVAETLVRVPVTVTAWPGWAKSGVTEVIVRDTRAPPGCAVAAVAGLRDPARPARATTEAAAARTARPVSGGRGMAEMVLLAAG